MPSPSDAAMPASCAVRRLFPAEAPAYRALLLRAMTEEPDAFTSTAAERAALPLDWWQARTSDSAAADTRTWGAFLANSLIGTVALEFNRREKIRHKASLIAMYVSPEARHRGIGLALVQTVIADARTDARLTNLQLTVTENNLPARRLYERAGFRLWGVEPLAGLWQGRALAKAHYWLPLRE